MSVDSASGVTTGISARDRATTARVLGDFDSGGVNLVRPGHVVVLANDDPAELTFSAAALRLAESAGQTPAAVMCDLVSPTEPTQMAIGAEPVKFALHHEIPWLTVTEAYCAASIEITGASSRSEADLSRQNQLHK